MVLTPMRLIRIPEPFDRPDFIFEPKIDGFRALAHIRGHRCELISRNGHPFKSWPQLAEEIAHAVRCRSAVLDGEICCLEPDGRSHFYKLLFGSATSIAGVVQASQSTFACETRRCVLQARPVSL